MLAVDVHQMLAQFLEHRERHRTVVDERAALARRGELAADDAVIGIIVDVIVLEESLHVVARQVEVGFYHTFLLRLLDDLGVGPLT